MINIQSFAKAKNTGSSGSPVRAVPLSLASIILALPLQKILLTSLPLLIRI